MQYGFYELYCRRKEFKNGAKMGSKMNKKDDLIDQSTYKWLLENNIVPYFDNPTNNILFDYFSKKKFRPLINVASILGIGVKNVSSQAFESLISVLRSKGIVSSRLDWSKIVLGDSNMLYSLLNDMFKASLISIPVFQNNNNKVNMWLKRVGIIVQNGYDSGSFHNPFTNGYVLRRVCIVFRPFCFLSEPPPCVSIKEAIVRTKQTLIVLCEEGILNENHIELSNDIASGNLERVYQILEIACDFYESKQNGFSNMDLG